jgi:hypothetical protein
MKRLERLEKTGISYTDYLRRTGTLPSMSKKKGKKIPMTDYLLYADYLRDVGMLPLTTIKRGTILFHGAEFPWNRFSQYTFFSQTPNLAMKFGHFIWVGILLTDVSMVDFRDSDEPAFKSNFCDTIFDCKLSDRKNDNDYPSLPRIIESRGADGWIAKDRDDELNYTEREEKCIDKELNKYTDETGNYYLDNEIVFRDPTILKTICWLTPAVSDRSIPFGIYYESIYQALLCTTEETPELWRESDIDPILKLLRDRWQCIDGSAIEKTHHCRYWIHPRDYVDEKEIESSDSMIESIERRLEYNQTSIVVLYKLVSRLKSISKDGWKYWHSINKLYMEMPY